MMKPAVMAFAMPMPSFSTPPPIAAIVSGWPIAFDVSSKAPATASCRSSGSEQEPFALQRLGDRLGDLIDELRRSG